MWGNRCEGGSGAGLWTPSWLRYSDVALASYLESFWDECSAWHTGIKSMLRVQRFHRLILRWVCPVFRQGLHPKCKVAGDAC